MSKKSDSPRVALVSLGCPKNLVDSEKMMAQLAEGGCVVGAPMDQADVVVVNTCGFLSAARDESLAVIREALTHKADGTARRVVVAGCLVNRDADKLFDLVPGIDAIVGVNDRDKLLKAVTGKRKNVTMLAEAKASTPQAPLATPSIVSDAGRFRLTPRHTAYLRVSEGCSQRCTFCTIPSIRGPFRSKLPQDVLAEARELIADGAFEINVIGQDTTSYGMDLQKAHGKRSVGVGRRDAVGKHDVIGSHDVVGNTVDLAQLMRSISDLDAARWIRLLYAYPMRFSQELIDVMAERDNIVKYVDIPLQHIADGVLRRMGRRVTRGRTEDLLHRLREVKGMTIRTTFIVGFPGESEAEFGELLEFVKQFKFDALGVFEFSPEEGTPAARLKGQLPAEVKAHRAEQVMLAQQKIVFAANRRRVGKTLEVLVDGVDAAGRCVGRHAGQAPDIDSVCILTKKRQAGRVVQAKVTGSDGYDLIVEP